MFRTKLFIYKKVFGRSLLVGSAMVTPSVVQNVDNPNPSAANTLTSTKNNENGWDRLRTMYSYDEWGNFSKELSAVFQTTFISGFFGLCYGGFMYSREAYFDFMERNQATKFTSHFEAKKRLQNHVTVNFGRGALKWSTRLAFFCGSFVLVITSISTYRGYTSLFDYMGGGIFAGTLYQFKLGPRGMIVGGVLGGVLGLLGGVMAQSMLAATGRSFQDFVEWQNQLDEARVEQMRKAEKKHAEDLLGENFKLLKEHDEKGNSS